MLSYCGVCKGYVESEGHTHPEKECQVCHQVKELAEFPIHASSIDGHRHTCSVCDAAEKEQEKTRRAQAKIQARKQRIEQQAQREKENLLLRAYGYRWKKETIAVDYGDGWEPEEGWVLYTPAGAQISLSDALQEIARLQEHKSSHPSTLWAKEMLARPHVLVLDTETTGFGPEAEIIDIALVGKDRWVHLNTLVQCQQDAISQEAMAVHRIHKSMLRNAPTFPQVWKSLLPLLSTYEIVIYNAEYDLQILRQTAKRYNLELPEMQVHCLMKQYSAYVGQASSHSEGYRSMKLAAACFHFQIEQTTTHRALADAQASLEVLRKLAAQSAQEE